VVTNANSPISATEAMPTQAFGEFVQMVTTYSCGHEHAHPVQSILLLFLFSHRIL
jgi:hypothetical protein